MHEAHSNLFLGATELNSSPTLCHQDNWKAVDERQIRRVLFKTFQTVQRGVQYTPLNLTLRLETNINFEIKIYYIHSGTLKI